MKPFLIGIAGGTAAGKSLVCRRISEKIERLVADTPTLQSDGDCEYVAVVRQESFYRDVDPTLPTNFDHPDSFDFDLMYATLKRLRDGAKYEVSDYDYDTNRKLPPVEKKPAVIVLVEGILAFYEERIRSLFDMRIFVDCDADIRLASRVVRDVCDRGRDLEQILKQYLDFAKPAFEQFVLPTKKYADVIIPRGAENEVAIGVIAQQTVDFLRHLQHENGAHSHNVSTTIANGQSSTANPLDFGTPVPSRAPNLTIRIEQNARREDSEFSSSEQNVTPPSAGTSTRLAPTLASPSASPGKRARHTSESENANRRH